MDKDNPYQFQFRYSHNSLEAFKTVNLKKRAKGRPTSLANIELPVLYENGRSINVKKLDDIMSLLQFIPPLYHDFYKKLRSTEDSEDSEIENE